MAGVLLLASCACALRNEAGPTVLMDPNATLRPGTYDEMDIEQMEKLVTSIQDFLETEGKDAEKLIDKSSLLAELAQLTMMLEQARAEQEAQEPTTSPTP